MVGGSFLKAMEQEHCDRPDSDVEFEVKGVHTTSKGEWEWLVAPQLGKTYAEAPVPLEAFKEKLNERNKQLRILKEQPLDDAEFVAARLLTSRVRSKYHAVFGFYAGIEYYKGQACEFRLGKWIDQLGAEPIWQWHNRYLTTLHAGNSAILKLSKLSRAAPLYRSLWKPLPDSFFIPDEFGIRGCVDAGFLSATSDREESLRYKQGDIQVLLEIEIGMTDRAADLSWLQTVPGNEYWLCSFLSCLQVLRERVEDRVLVIECSLKVNHMGALEWQTPVEISALVDADEIAASEEEVSRAEGAAGKPCELISGQPKAAAMGLYHFMRVKDPFAHSCTAGLEEEISGFVGKLREHALLATLLSTASEEQRAAAEQISQGASVAEKEIAYFRRISWSAKDATPAEVVSRVEEEVLGNLKYILYETASEVYVQGPNSIRDEGRGPVTFEDFMKDPNVQAAEMTRPQVAALRLYTTLAYKYINTPLRDQKEYYEQCKPHPLPKTVAFIADGIKKLRAAYATRVAAGKAKPVCAVWRGMKNINMSDDFMSVDENGNYKGGTELAPMSTTTDFAVAAKYSKSDQSLLFKVTLDNFMQYGAEVTWLSAFPREEEVLYPPLTYLQPTGREQQLTLKSGHVFEVVEVKPTLP